MSAVHSYTAAANLSLAFVEKMICSSRRLRLVALRRYCLISCIGFSELPLLGGGGVAGGGGGGGLRLRLECRSGRDPHRLPFRGVKKKRSFVFSLNFIAFVTSISKEPSLGSNFAPRHKAGTGCKARGGAL